MRTLRICACTYLAILGFALCASAGEDSRCKEVRGKIVWTVIQAPNDPFGRVLGSATGALHGATSAIILGVTPGAGGVLNTHDLDIFVTGAQDMLVGDSHATFTPILTSPGSVQDSQVITITGGTGKFAGATGSLKVQGKGFNLSPTGGVPGVSFFDVDYSGSVCTANWDGTEK